MLAAATDLLVVGRAGIGLDNVDVEAATARGVMVVNAPQSNIVLGGRAHDGAAARPGPQRPPGPRRARRRSLGAQQVGGRRAGRQDARHRRPRPHRQARRRPGPRLRHAARRLRPVRVRRAGRQLGVELLPLDQVVAESDFLTIHLPKTAETTGLIGRDLLLKAKPTLRVINVARGGIVDEAALADAIRDGIIAGAALDVFDTEPTTESPLFELDSVVVTPHLGASTREAQDKAGDTIADMVQLALAGEFVPFAVNLAAAEAHDDLRPFLPLAERLGGLFGSLVGVSALPESGCRRRSRSASRATSAPTTRASSGCRCSRACSAGVSDEPVTYVNAPQRARDAGLDVREVCSTTSADYVNLITDLAAAATRSRARCTGGAASTASCSSTGTRSTCRRPTTC